MSTKRRNHSDKFKFNVALEATARLKTISQIASEHNLHPNQVTSWKKKLMENGSSVFTKKTTRQAQEQIWSTDITYIPMAHGFMYLVIVMDWFSHYVLAWQLSNMLDGAFCLLALEMALQHGRPNIFNSGQGSQFTAHDFTARLLADSIRVSMDSRGRAFDNIFIEWLWRSVKYEDIYLQNYETVPLLETGLSNYFRFYNCERPHQSLAYRTPAEVHFGC
ncbi:MAG: IS3 family transposase [Chloroflexi bacterium]|nr:IS3 family transposase [Chloroflexota bacterium]